MAEKYSGNFRVMDAGGMTQSLIGVRYNEDGTPISGVVFSVNTVSKLETYHANQLVLLPSDWQSWSMQNLPPTGLLCVHTEDYGLGEADNVLADAERLRKKVLDEMRGGALVEETVEESPSPAPQADAAPTKPTGGSADGLIKQQRKQLRKEK